MRYLLFVGFIAVLFFTSCEEENKSFAYDLAILKNTKWTNPKVEEADVDHQQINLSSPVIFHDDGIAEIGSQKDDYWEVYDEKSILLHNRSQLWRFLELTPDKMRVEKYTFPETRFTVRMVYEARDGS